MMKLGRVVRLWSVQAAAVGGALTAFLAALQEQGVPVPSVLLAASGLLTAVSVALARALPQDDVTSEGD